MSGSGNQPFSSRRSWFPEKASWESAGSRYRVSRVPGFVRVGSLMGLGFILLIAAFVFERLVLRADASAEDDAGQPDATPDSTEHPNEERD